MRAGSARHVLTVAAAALLLAACGGEDEKTAKSPGGANPGDSINQPINRKVPGTSRAWGLVTDPKDEDSYVERRTPRRPHPEAGASLPPPSSRDPQFTIKIGEKKNSTGTAFAIADSGVWLTARHVAFGCRVIGILTGPRKGFKVLKSVIHPNADVAILFTEKGAPYFPVAPANHRLALGQSGFHFGYPRGKPGDVHSRIMGRRIMRVQGRYSTAEPVVAWAEQARFPETQGPLSGLSGGPILDKDGTVVGVHVAGSIRRGRIYSVTPNSMHQVIQQARARIGGQRQNSLDRNMLNPQDYPRYGAEVRRQLTSAKVLCLVNDPGQQQRRPPPRYDTSGEGSDPA